MVTNEDVVRTLERVAGLLEIRGENIYKVRAYRTAAAQVENSGESLNDIAAREDGLLSIDGFGPAVAEKVAEILTTGRLGFLEQLESEVPPTLLALRELPGVGPRTAALLWHEAGITTMDQLAVAARSGRLEGMPRLGERTVERILAALEAHQERGVRSRRPRPEVEARAMELRDALRALPEAASVELAGSFRRGRDTVKDLDVLVATDQPSRVLSAFAALPAVERVLLRGETKCSIELDGGFQVDCRAVTSDQFGAAMQYFTGSQAHNVRLRGRAIRRGLLLNEYGVFRVDDATRVAGQTEEDVYAALGLRWIPPHQREDHGEVDAAELDAVQVSGQPITSVPQEV